MKVKYIENGESKELIAKSIRETPHGYLVHIEGNSFYLKNIEEIEP